MSVCQARPGSSAGTVRPLSTVLDGAFKCLAGLEEVELQTLGMRMSIVSHGLDDAVWVSVKRLMKGDDRRCLTAIEPAGD